MNHADWRTELVRARRFARRLDPAAPMAPVPPPLPEARLVRVEGRGEVFVRESGTGAPVALLHGWTASADLNWFRAYDAVSAVGRMIAVDHRGHGRGIRTQQRFTLEDAADDVAATLREMDAAPAVLVGYSMGGPIAMLTWLRHPDVVRGLVLEATAMEWRERASERVAWRFMAALEFFFRLGRPRGLIDRAIREMVEQSPDLEPIVGWLHGELRRGDPEALADAGRSLGRFDFRRAAPSVSVPTAVVVTTRDRLVRPRKQRALAAAIPRSRSFELAGDHDAPLVLGDAFPRVTAEAVRWVIDQAGDESPAYDPAPWGSTATG